VIAAAPERQVFIRRFLSADVSRRGFGASSSFWPGGVQLIPERRCDAARAPRCFASWQLRPVWG